MFKYLWIGLIGLIYILYAGSAISDIVTAIRYKEEISRSTIVFIISNYVIIGLVSFIWWVVTL
jgi:hypothetical protein